MSIELAVFTLTRAAYQVEVGDVDPIATLVHALQRSLVSRRLLMADTTRREPAG